MKYVIWFIVILPVSLALAQPNPDTLWTRTYGTTYGDDLYSVRQTTDGGYIVAGYFRDGDPILKLDSSGAMQWSYEFDPPSGETAYDVIQTQDGGYVFSEDIGQPYNYGSRIVKIDSAGEFEWVGGTEYPQYYIIYSIQQTPDGGFCAAGRYSGDSHDFLLARYDSVGTLVWRSWFGGDDTERAYSVMQCPDGGFMLAGYTNSFGAGNSDYYLVKADSEGVLEWDRTYGGYFRDYCNDATITEDGGCIMVGSSISYGIGLYDIWAVRTDSNGDTIWTRALGGYSAQSISPTSDGGFIIAGRTEEFAPNNYDFILIKIDGDGNILWTRSYGGDGYDEAYSVQQTTDGGFIVGGVTESFGAGNDDIYLVKTGPDISSAIPSESVAVIPHTMTLYPCYPNPFNPTTTISYAISSPGMVRLAIYNVMCQEVATLINGVQDSGIHHITWDASNVSSGVYFAQLKSADNIKTMKMVLLK